MNVINIVKIFCISEIVLHFELLKNLIHIQYCSCPKRTCQKFYIKIKIILITIFIYFFILTKIIYNYIIKYNFWSSTKNWKNTGDIQILNSDNHDYYWLWIIHFLSDEKMRIFRFTWLVNNTTSMIDTLCVYTFPIIIFRIRLSVYCCSVVYY